MRRLLAYMMKYGWIFFLLLIIAFASNIGNLLGPSFAGKAINEASAGAGKVNMQLVIRYGLLMLLVYVGSNILSFLVNIHIHASFEDVRGVGILFLLLNEGFEFVIVTD